MTDMVESLNRHLPYLRRYARALTGTQGAGDAYVGAALEKLIADGASIGADDNARLLLFQALHAVWMDGDAADIVPADTGSRPSGAEGRLEAVSERSSELLLLSLLEGFSDREVAQILDLSLAEARAQTEQAIMEISAVAASDILIIEDEPVIAMELSRIVEELGHRVKGTAATRSDAVERSQNGAAPDLILADIRLADGSSGLDAVNDMNADGAIPTIFITAYPEEFLTGKKPEPAFLISKPFQPDQIKATVSQCLFVEMHRRQQAQAATGMPE